MRSYNSVFHFILVKNVKDSPILYGIQLKLLKISDTNMPSLRNGNPQAMTVTTTHLKVLGHQ